MHIVRLTGTTRALFTDVQIGDFRNVIVNHAITSGVLGKVLSKDYRRRPLDLDRNFRIKPLHIIQAHTHGDRIHLAESGNGETQIADAVIWRGRGNAFFAPADCLGIVVRDESSGLTGLIHGSVATLGQQQIIAKFAAAWREQGGQVRESVASFLPSICQACLKYDPTYYEQNLAKNFRDLPAEIATRHHGNVHLSIQLIAMHQLHQQGFETVQDCQVCTCCNRHYYSHRRQGSGAGRNGALVITHHSTS